MGRNYKLRLRDGTTLVVDYAGLRTWLLDDRAMVQAEGARGWRRLKQFLAEEPPPDSTRVSSPAVASRVAGPPPSLVAESLPVLGETLDSGAVDSSTMDSSAIDQTAALPLAANVDGALDLGEVARSAVRAGSRPAAPPKPVPVDKLPIIPFKPVDVDLREDKTPRRPVPRPTLANEGFHEDFELTEVDPVEKDERFDELERVEEKRPGWRATRAASPPVGLSAELGRIKAALVTFFFKIKTAPRTKALLAAVAARFSRQRPAPGKPGTSSTPSPARRPGLQPPPHISELPVLRLAPMKDERMTGDVYQGGPVAGRRRLAKGAVLIASLAAVAVALAIWLPTLKPSTPPPRPAEQSPSTPPPSLPAPEPPPLPSPNDVRAAAIRLPHLAPETIRLVMSRSDFGPPNPLEVFRRAHDAIRRGRSALRGYDVQELWDLETAAMIALRPAEQKRVRAYDRLRAVGGPATDEDGRVLELVARSARALAPRSRQRLQALLAKALEAGLPPDPSLPQQAAPVTAR